MSISAFDSFCTVDCESVAFVVLGTTNTVEDMVDKAVISTNNWFVYLSSKPNRQPYKLTRALDNASKDIAFKQSRKLVPFLSVAGDVENVSYIKELPLNSSNEKTTLAQPQETARSLPQGENSEDVDQQNDENEEHDQVQF